MKERKPGDSTRGYGVNSASSADVLPRPGGELRQTVGIDDFTSLYAVLKRTGTRRELLSVEKVLDQPDLIEQVTGRALSMGDPDAVVVATHVHQLLVEVIRKLPLADRQIASIHFVTESAFADLEVTRRFEAADRLSEIAPHTPRWPSANTYYKQHKRVLQRIARDLLRTERNAATVLSDLAPSVLLAHQPESVENLFAMITDLEYLQFAIIARRKAAQFIAHLDPASPFRIEIERNFHEGRMYTGLLRSFDEVSQLFVWMKNTYDGRALMRQLGPSFRELFDLMPTHHGYSLALREAIEDHQSRPREEREESDHPKAAKYLSAFCEAAIYGRHGIDAEPPLPVADWFSQSASAIDGAWAALAAVFPFDVSTRSGVTARIDGMLAVTLDFPVRAEELRGREHLQALIAAIHSGTELWMRTAPTWSRQTYEELAAEGYETPVEFGDLAELMMPIQRLGHYRLPDD